MIKHILVALDGSALAEATLPFVERVARGGEAEVTLLRVVPPPSTTGVLVRSTSELLPFMASIPIERPEASAEAARVARYEAERYLDALDDRLGSQGIIARGVVVVGEPAPTVIEEAGQRDADLIALGTRGRSGLGRWIYGSVAEAIVAQSPVPVFLARSGAFAEPGRWSSGDLSTDAPILVPLDGTPRAEMAVSVAASLSLQIGTSVHLLQIVVPPEDTIPSYWATDVLRTTVDDHEVGAQAYLAEMVRRLRAQGVRATASVETDDIGIGIAREARVRKASLVVMATHAYTPLTRVFLHSVAQEVLHRVALSVIFLGPGLMNGGSLRGASPEPVETCHGRGQ